MPRSAAPGPDATGNKLLASLPAEEFSRLLPYLEPVSHPAKTRLCEPDNPIRHVYFPTAGVISLLALRASGGGIEAGMVGREGFVGLPVFLGTDRSTGTSVVQLPLQAVRMSADNFRAVVPRDGSLHALLLRYTHFLLCQISQSLACCASCAVEKRFCRWLLTVHDRAENDEFPLTHAFMANMMGVRRASVSQVAAGLQQRGLIGYERGRLTVLNRSGLEVTACGCFEVVRNEWERLFG
jgi:CRP-like cAMP-binding protein